jgi:peptidoglycan hydrolase-like protein with peptidoglycan-binding domain
MLSVLSSSIAEIPPVTVDGIYGNGTRAAVLAAQRFFRLPETGSVGVQTWDLIYDQFAGIENVTFRNGEIFPNGSSRTGRNGRNQYARTSLHTQYPGRNLSSGSRDPVAQEVVR